MGFISLHRLIKLFVVLFLCTLSTSWNSCPCEPPPSLDYRPNNRIVFCILSSSTTRKTSFSLSHTISYRSINNIHQSNDCNAVFLFSNTSDRPMCPGTCSSVPIIELPMAPTNSNHFDENTALMCSFTLGMLIADANNASSHLYSIHYFSTTNNLLTVLSDEMLLILYYRRKAECNEKHLWQSIQLQHISPRPVHCLIIWIGSIDRKHLLDAQQRILLHEPYNGPNAIIGWGASDIEYPCRIGSTLCTHNTTPAGDFKGHIPKTTLHTDKRGFGWSCAQRRPLRTLAHTLSLFIPNYIIMVDDDTYVNYALIERSYRMLIDSDMKYEPLVIGHYIMKKAITTKGFFFGGTGYIIGSKAIERLTDRAIRHVRVPKADRYGMDLSLVNEIRYSNASCASSCVLSGTMVNGAFPLASRLVDVCTHMMASEHTCYHSDYAMGRCLFYGVHIIPMEITCNANDALKMCYYSSETCELNTHLTCHRWVADVNLQPQPIPSN